MIAGYDCLIFDLDGTLSDPKEGITKSINYALEQYNHEAVCNERLTQYIGPPLDETFIDITGIQDSSHINNLIASYRERYADIGYKENIAYKTIKEVLTYFSNQNIDMGVCTSKPVRFARPILEMFDFDQYFRFISGGETGIQKHLQLTLLLHEKAITSHSIMIGDRAVDITAAQKNNLDSAAVLWGFGSREELEGVNPTYIYKTPRDLQKALGTANGC